ncbi:MAG: anti-sigma factor antagonist [Roseburia sp.]|uniref:STAS domain-containing protein n=1 Tax=Roseburia sp. 831b TaxID=1261635 RepID=UPI000952DEAF|nr:anti-sigma factor antagonist [Roseburia sp. 831b]MCI5919741.1 anti-sigma factor antagonist [Roseburia sp.]MDD6215630.1 anti-sigma factor antagonist [Roseburia sp.]MDY5884515.1 anti-sigma factor antagonist [Roseburia sp.]WVK73265.1 anti-sigma factor antagonist [Roseburia sp. 831b]
MECKYELKGGNLTIRMPKELDHHCASQIQVEADLLLQSYLVKRLVFDFSETEFMDSSGIGVIIGRYQNLRYAGGEVVASHLNARMSKIFVISGLHKIVKIEKEEDGSESGDEK